jgi:zinc/manganese transport system permease protein
LTEGINAPLWDFLFYATFGLVVTSSVHIAGVLLVFSILVIPPVIGLFFARSSGRRLVIGWSVAFAGAIIGILGSLQMDLPTGPSIMICLILMLIVAALVRRLVNRRCDPSIIDDRESIREPKARAI